MSMSLTRFCLGLVDGCLQLGCHLVAYEAFLSSRATNGFTRCASGGEQVFA